MKRRTLLLSVAGGALLVALLGWAFAPRPMPVEVATAAVGPFETTIDEDARTRIDAVRHAPCAQETRPRP